jgi:hypothetical protein
MPETVEPSKIALGVLAVLNAGRAAPSRGATAAIEAEAAVVPPAA